MTLAPRPAPVGGPALSAGGAGGVALIVVVIAALYFARDVLLPLALAGLLSFALAPLVSVLRRRSIPRTIAVGAVVLSAFLCIGVFGLIVTGQVTQLGANLPTYEQNIQDKIQSLKSSSASDGLFERAAETLRHLRRDIDEAAMAPPDAAPAPTSEQTTRQPIPVQITQPDPAPLQLLQTIVGPLIEPLATTGIVVVFVVFMLLQKEDLRDRFIRLAGSRDLHRTTRALDDAARRVGRYLLMQLVVNTTYGVPIGIGLWLIGVPNPLLWGMLAMMLRFVPFIGPVIAAVFPLVLAVAVDPGWTMLFWTAALFIVAELICGNVLEPWLYGASTGLSPLAVLATAIFWTWLWGPVGLLLSTPLTVCLVVLGQHAPQFAFLNILLGNEPVLTPEESLYQRLLAGDPDEATERAEDYLRTHDPLEYYQDVALPALAMVEADRARGVLTDERREIVAAGATLLVENLGALDEPGDAETPREPSAQGAGPVLCIGGRGNLDDVAALILAQMLERRGIEAKGISFADIAGIGQSRPDFGAARLICLSYLNPGSVAHARYAIRRLRKHTGLPIVPAFWSASGEDQTAEGLAEATGSSFVVTRLGEALEEIGDRLADRSALDIAKDVPPSELERA